MRLSDQNDWFLQAKVMFINELAVMLGDSANINRYNKK